MQKGDSSFSQTTINIRIINATLYDFHSDTICDFIFCNTTTFTTTLNVMGYVGIIVSSQTVYNYNISFNTNGINTVVNMNAYS